MLKKLYKPMLAREAKKIPAWGEWEAELKLDGFRAIVYVDNGRIRIRSRANRNLTPQFSAIAEALPRVIKAKSCVLDGEIIARDKKGQPNFSMLLRGKGCIQLYLFDALEIDGQSLVVQPLYERRRQLKKLIRKNTIIFVTETFSGDEIDQLWQEVVEQELEGIVVKRRDSRYRGGYSWKWLKIKPEYFKRSGKTRHR